MDGKQLKYYLLEFERSVIKLGVERGVFGDGKEEVVPLRSGKLSKEPLGEFVGDIFDSDKVIAINYYGLYKLSRGIFRAVESVKIMFPDVRSIKSPVVHFNSLKAENIIALAPNLAPGYDEFKKYIVRLRWYTDGTTQECSGSE